MKIPPRELECLKLVVCGYSSKEVAEVMEISIKTVEKFRSLSYWRLKVDRTIPLLRAALRNELITFEEFLACTKGENCFHQTPQGKSER